MSILATQMQVHFHGALLRRVRTMIFEIVFVLLLICLNGLLAMSELAVVSSRPARLKSRAEEGDRNAGIALGLAEDSGKFLSTVQIGITLVGVLAGAFSGATIGVSLADFLSGIGVPRTVANELGVGLVVVCITYLSLIIGELVPKQIALAAPERVASRVAPTMLRLSRIAAPLVWLLDRSGKLVLRLLGHSDERDTTVDEDDIRMTVSEAAGAGVIRKAEKDMIGGVMHFSDCHAHDLMTPLHDVEIAEAHETRMKFLSRLQGCGHSRLPLRDGGPDDIVGVLHSRDLLATTDTEFDPLTLLLPAPVIGQNLPALDVVERLRSSPSHMLLVYDDHGHFRGIVTPIDVLAAIAGDFGEPDYPESKAGSLGAA